MAYAPRKREPRIVHDDGYSTHGVTQRIAGSSRSSRPPTKLPEDDPLEVYEPGTVLDEDDHEVVELLREIAEWDRRGRL